MKSARLKMVSEISTRIEEALIESKELRNHVLNYKKVEREAQSKLKELREKLQHESGGGKRIIKWQISTLITCFKDEEIVFGQQDKGSITFRMYTARKIRNKCAKDLAQEIISEYQASYQDMFTGYDSYITKEMKEL